MTDSAALERSYRRVLACYPRSFRRDNEDEILAVLMATAGEGQMRIGPAEAADLVRGELNARLDAAFTATTRREIAQTTRDLPRLPAA